MSCSNPTNRGNCRVVLSLPPAQVEYLLWAFGEAKLGREDDLRTHPDDPKSSRWREEAVAYGRILDGLEAGEVIANNDVRRLVRELAEATDREEEYDRVVAEHAALVGLLDQIGGRR